MIINFLGQLYFVYYSAHSELPNLPSKLSLESVTIYVSDIYLQIIPVLKFLQYTGMAEAGGQGGHIPTQILAE